MAVKDFFKKCKRECSVIWRSPAPGGPCDSREKERLLAGGRCDWPCCNWHTCTWTPINFFQVCSTPYGRLSNWCETKIKPNVRAARFCSEQAQLKLQNPPITGLHQQPAFLLRLPQTGQVPGGIWAANTNFQFSAQSFHFLTKLNSTAFCRHSSSGTRGKWSSGKIADGFACPWP